MAKLRGDVGKLVEGTAGKIRIVRVVSAMLGVALIISALAKGMNMQLLLSGVMFLGLGLIMDVYDTDSVNRKKIAISAGAFVMFIVGLVIVWLSADDRLSPQATQRLLQGIGLTLLAITVINSKLMHHLIITK
jgi:hypothetical protein